MRSAAIYPITSDNQFLLKELNGMFGEFKITTAVVPYAFANEVKANNYEVCHKITDVVEAVNAVIFVSFWDTQRMFKEITMVLEHGIDVISTIPFSKDEGARLQQTATLHNAEFRAAINPHFSKLLKERDDVYSQPESIVIAVSAITKSISSSELVVNFFNALNKAGYSVGVMCSDPDLQLIHGYEWLPIDEMIADNLDRCIMKINSFVNFLQVTYKPNIIIVQLPDEGLFRMSYDFASCFGARTYLVSQAVDFDYGVVLSPLIDSDLTLYEHLSEISKSRFGFAYNSICITPKSANVDIAQGEETMRYYTVSSDQLADNVQELKQRAIDGTFIFSSEEEYTSKLVNHLVSFLS